MNRMDSMSTGNGSYYYVNTTTHCTGNEWLPNAFERWNDVQYYIKIYFCPCSYDFVYLVIVINSKRKNKNIRVDIDYDYINEFHTRSALSVDCEPKRKLSRTALSSSHRTYATIKLTLNFIYRSAFFILFFVFFRIFRSIFCVDGSNVVASYWNWKHISI